MKIAILALALAGGAPAQMFDVAGVVHDGVTGSPMKRVRVTIDAGNLREQAVITGEDGRFHFSVAKGKYRLMAAYREMRQIYGLRGPGLGFGVSIYTGPDQDTGNLDFRWFPPGAITGKIVDDRGETAQSMLVQLIRESVVGGEKRWATAGWEYTNDLGEYRFGALVGGTYYLAVTGAPWYARSFSAQNRIAELMVRSALGGGNPGPAPSGPTPGEANFAYAPVYYPDALDAGSAAALKLAAGGEVRADFSVKTVAGVDVRVRVPSDSKIPSTSRLNLLADGIGGVEGFQRSENLMVRGETRISGVPPGRYIVRISAAGEGAFLAQKVIDVGASDVVVEIAPEPAPSAAGTVSMASPRVRRRGNLSMRLTDQSGRSYTQPVNADGSFRFPVAVGKWRATLTGPDGLFITQLTAEGGNLQNGRVDIGPGAAIRLNITASDETGDVKGHVVAGEKPVAGVLVVLAPGGSDRRFETPRSFQTDSDGSFDMAKLPAGEYVLFATEQLDLEYANPEAVRPYLAAGKSVEVKAGSVWSGDIGLVAAGR